MNFRRNKWLAHSSCFMYTLLVRFGLRTSPPPPHFPWSQSVHTCCGNNSVFSLRPHIAFTALVEHVFDGVYTTVTNAVSHVIQVENCRSSVNCVDLVVQAAEATLLSDLCAYMISRGTSILIYVFIRGTVRKLLNTPDPLTLVYTLGCRLTVQLV